MSRIRIISTGGTIGNTRQGRVSLDRVLLDIESWFPDSHPSRYADLETVEVIRRGAETFTPDDWMTIRAATVEASEDPSVDAIVITHGTFTAEETAYFLHLTVPTAKPLVMACSQRRHATIGNDGDRNLVDAIRVATSEAARGLGMLVVLNEEIHSAREVTKSSRRPSGFTSRTLGVLGTIEEDRVSFFRSPTRRHTVDSEFSSLGGPLSRVDVVNTYAGADGVAVGAFVAAGAKGLVVNGFSYSGKPHENQLPELRAALEGGVPVVLVNRGGDGRMHAESGDGFVRGDNLTYQKARILLMLAMTRFSDPAELQRIFNEY